MLARLVALFAGVCIACAASARPGPMPGLLQPERPAPPQAARPAEPGSLDAATKAKAEEMITRAIGYLRSQQDAKTGGWAVPPQGPVYPAITGLVLNGMLMQPGITETDPAVATGVAFILNYRQPDGGIYDKVLASYNTSICLSTLVRVGTPEARAAIKPAQDFLRSLQFSEDAITDGPAAGETRRVGREHPFYGGVGYGGSGRPDNSNLTFFLQAMHDTGVDAGDPAIQRALVFLQRTQMLDAVNELPYADGSAQGGFIYSTSRNKDTLGVGQSYAGEIAESLSGGPGTVIAIALKPKDGKPVRLKRADLADRLKEAFAASPDAGVRAAADQMIVVVGPTGDGESSDRFEVRTPITGEATAAASAAVMQALARGGEGSAEFKMTPAAVWRGVSRLRAYGSMSYAGFKSYLYAELRHDDPRVAAAYNWVRSNYTLAENPGMGTDGLYYYFVTFARALDAWGEPSIGVIGDGGAATPHDWRADLINRLAELQQADGSFRSVDDRWLENNPVLITAYSLLALEHAVRHTPKHAAAPDGGGLKIDF